MAEVVKGIVDIEINTGSAAAELKILQQQINSVFLSLNKNNTASLAASQKYSSSLADMVNSSKVFTAESVRMRTAAGALDDTLKKGQATLGQYFSAKYVRNGALFAETLDLARQKASVLQTQFVATGKSSKGMQDALAIRPLQAFADQTTIASQRTQILSSMFRQGTTQLINFGKNVQWAGRQLMVGFTVPLTIFGTTAGKVFADLEKQTVAFKKVYGDLFTTPRELQQNLKAVQDLAKEYTKYGIAIKDTISLAAEAAAAGRQNSELLDAVEQSTRLATLGQMDQNAALETTIALQSAFKLSGAELANTINFLNMVENQTVVTLQDIAAAIPRVAPVIEGLGGSVQDLTVFLAAMQEGGVSAEQGANALKSGLASLINPSKSATEALGKVGVNIDAIIQANKGDLMKTVTGFAEALSTLGEFEQQQALEQVFGKFQYARLGALFENIIREGSQAKQVIDTLGYSVEELAMTADKELKTIEEAFSVQLRGAIERFKLAIAPIGEIFVKLGIPLVNFATRIADAFNNLPDFSKKFIAFAAIITGLVIPAGTMFFGLLMNLTGTLAKLFQFMGAFGKGFLQGGIVGAFKNATQSTKYFSTAEIEAALAAQQLGTATEFTNSALRKQVTQAMGAAGAVKYLGDSYTLLIAKMMEAARLAPYTMGVGQTAAGLAKSGRSATGRIIRPPQMRNDGGRIFMSDGSTVPGTGNSDTVPAMLTPGEFIVNKNATRQNLGLLYAINGGGAGYNKGGVTYASRGAYLGPREALERSAAELGVFTSNRRASATKATVAGAASKEGIQRLLNNLVYLINPTTNKQLIGNRIMGGFDKRGVPLDQLKKEMTSDIGMWMIDAYAGQKWAKTAYKTTLSNNFNSIAAKYPGKEIRFLDSKGFERIKDVMDRPEYGNVKFVSVKDLHNKDLYNRLSPDHLQRLLSDDTANVITQRMRSSTGKIGPRSGYQDLNSNSYTKMQKSWRGNKRPLGFEGAHMYNMGGKVLYANGGALVSKNYAYDSVALAGNDAATFNRQMNTLYNTKQMRSIDKSTLPLYMQADNLPLNSNHAKQLYQFLIDNKVSPRKYPDVYSFLSSAIKNPDLYNARILEGLLASDKNNLLQKGLTSGEADKKSKSNLFNALSKSGYGKVSNIEDALFTLSNLDEHTSSKFLQNRMKQGPMAKVRFGKGYSKEKAILGGKAIFGRTRLHVTTPSQMTKMNNIIRRNKGGMIPGVQYANIGKMISRAMGLNADNALGAFGLLKPTIRTGAKTAIPKNLTMKEIFEHENFKEGTYLVSPQGGQPYEANLFYWNGKPKLKRYGQYNVGSGIGTQTRQFDSIDIDPNMKASIYNKNEYTGSNVSGPFKANKGNIVPGTGNTDTVPAMLTPGEFVINKEATRNNMALLKAINNGSMAGYNMGGKIPGVQYLVRGGLTNAQRVSQYKSEFPTATTAEAVQALGIDPTQSKTSKGFSINPMAQMGMMSAGFMLPMLGQQMQQSTNELSKGIGNFLGFLTPAAMLLAVMPSKLGAMIAGIVLAGTAIYKVIQKFKEIQKSGSTFVKAMYGSAESTKAFAETFGRQSNASKLAQQQAGLISPEATQAASQFIGTDAGKKLIEDVRTATKLGGEAVDSLRNQLMRQVISGIITQEEAKGIATEVGVALGNQQIGIDVSAQITKILGVNGSDILKDPQGIIATMTPKIDEQAIKKQAEFLYKEQTKGFMGGITKLFDIQSMQQYKIQQGLIAESAVQSAAIEREARASIDLALQQNRISVEKYLAVVNSMSTNSAAGQITENFFNREDVAKATKDFEIVKKMFDNAINNKQAVSPGQGAAYARAETNFNNIVGPFSKQMEAGVTEAFKNAGIEYLNEDFKNSIDKIASGNKGVAAQLNSLVLTGGMSLNMAGAISGFTDDQVANLQANAKKAGLSVDNYIRKIGLLSDANLQAAVLEIAVKANEGGTPIDLDELQKNLATILTLPAELRTNLRINVSDPADVMEYGPKAKEIKKQYDEINKYIKDKNKDLSSEPIRQEIITRFAGENKDFVQKMISIMGKDFDETKLPLLISASMDEKTRTYLEYLSTPGYKGGTNFMSGDVGAKMLLDMFGKSSTEGTTSPTGTGEKSQIQQMRDSAKETKAYANAIKILRKESVLTEEQLSSMSAELAIEISKRKDKNKVLQEFKTLYINQRKIDQELLTDSEKQLQVLDVQEKVYSRQLTLIDRRINAKQKDINKEQDLNEIRQKGLDSLSKEEQKINDVYDARIKALDDVNSSNERNASRQRSRINLATSLAGGDIAAAAAAAAEITSKEAQYKLEDARTLLETQRQRQIDALTTSVNNKLMTRKEIESAIESSNERIYDISQSIKNIETEKLSIYNLQEQSADKRFRLELQALAATTQNKEVYEEINRLANEHNLIVANRPSSDFSPITSTNVPSTIAPKTSTGSSSNLKKIQELKLETKKPYVNPYAYQYTQPYYAPVKTSISKSRFYAMGGMVNYKGSKEPPPAVKMAYGSMVPGMGNTDRVPALLTPGEFVIRKSVASAYMPLLEQLNGNIYPGAAMPKGSAKNNSNLYNNSYSINVNVAGTDASPNEIANAVMSKIKQVESRSLRGVKVV